MAESSSGTLTTHVLDTATGKPAANLSLALYKLGGGGRAADDPEDADQ